MKNNLEEKSDYTSWPKREIKKELTHALRKDGYPESVIRYIVRVVNVHQELMEFVQDVIDGNMEYEQLQLNALAVRAKAKGMK